jgi:hypothetical protein
VLLALGAAAAADAPALVDYLLSGVLWQSAEEGWGKACLAPAFSRTTF